MKKINLKSSDSVAVPKKRKSGASIAFGIVVLVISVGAYGGATYLKKEKEREVEAVRKEVTNIREGMNKDEYKDLYDFQTRLSQIDELIGDKLILDAFLEKISTYTLSKSVFSDFSIKRDQKGKGTEVGIVMNLPGLKDAAEQVEAYSQIDSALDVHMAEAQSSELGGFDVKIILEINNKTSEETTSQE